MQGAIITGADTYWLTSQIGICYLQAAQTSCMTSLYLSFLVAFQHLGDF